MRLEDSLTFGKYRETAKRILKRTLIPFKDHELDEAINYSINKRYFESKCVLDNTYTDKKYEMTLLKMADYIAKKEPIVTAHGTLFKKHADCPNPMGEVIQLFLDTRSKQKKMMFRFPKGSEEFEKYNLLQQLSKIDANGIYGVLGMYTSLLFNINVSSSITSQGRALISSASLFFESFLSDNVKFGSLDEVLVFIDNICGEKRNYKDENLLDKSISVEDCFAKLINECGYKMYYPSEEDMDIIWTTLQNLGQEDINRIYYKNNLYEFMSNKSMIKAIRIIMSKLESPFFNSLDVPKEIEAELEELSDILAEYVFYNKMYIDRIDRCDNMMKSTIMVSDTDSCIVSLDAWYRFVLKVIEGLDLKILRYDPINVIRIIDKDEFGDPKNMDDLSPITEMDPEERYNFEDDEIIENLHLINPLTVYPQDNLRYSIINIMAFVVDKLINKYMEQFTKNNHSWAPEKPCKIILKNEFTFLRLLMTSVKKSYASIMAVQEGNLIPKGEQLDIKGIACMAKSSMSKSTRDALKQILLEEILTSSTIDQFRVIERLAILERRIINSIQSGSKEFYKPVTIKSENSYSKPMTIQGIKGSYIWNELRPSNLPAIDTSERNAIMIAKVNLNMKNVEKLKDKYPDVYQNAIELFDRDNNRPKDQRYYKGSIDSIAIPLDVETPDWLMEIIDYNTIVNDNLSGFVYDSIGIVNLDPKSNKTNYSNILQL